MARLASDAKMGFYPTDTNTIKKVIDKTIEFPKNKVHALDCSAGDGEAIEFIANEYNCDAFAVELDKYRAMALEKRNITKSLNADALHGVRKSNTWAGINFMNPPYGTNSFNERLELDFVKRWGGATSRGGILILVVNPSCIEENMIRALRMQGYKAVGSFYDENNQDYKKFKQRFILLQRIALNFRDSLENILNALENPKNIDDEFEFEKIKITTGGKPEMFNEFQVPEWKLKRDLENSSGFKKSFFQNLRSSKIATTSIELPNEGQSAILIAGGALNKKITLKNGDKVILKGTCKKIVHEIITELPTTDDEGTVKVRESYKTVIYGLNLSKGIFQKFE